MKEDAFEDDAVNSAQVCEIRLKVPAPFYESIRQTCLDRGDTISSFVRNAIADKISTLQANKAASVAPMMIQIFNKMMSDVIAEESNKKAK